ncbi:2-keto-4-pentenoate hydratase [Siculibacillus lacustris]|uniref:2-keto-4-pentenoate hydratase n=1 Tax=Siculibacillus lacustris TaxID=1549641 RepID=A0A4Q9VL87_9HYPH|nr:fumarylacetoacetate hydrolase family protein [Siculibacillus lacustris]TBW36133.1 2-keto-4-pentenoate hydratase [Siculibacillus lacustris]
MTDSPSVSCDRAAAVAALLEARTAGLRLAALPEGARPRDVADAEAIEDEVARRLGPVVAWKVGAPSPTARPMRSPILASTLHVEVDELPRDAFFVAGIEAEIVFRFARDLPVRDAPWTRDEVVAAIGSVHPAFEICDTRFEAFGSQDSLSHLADQGSHGALIVGAAAPVDAARIARGFADQPITLDIDGRRVADVVGGNSAGDPLRLLMWMADEGARSFGGLKAGDTVTTGSCTGTLFIEAGAVAIATYPGLGTITLRLV